MDRHITRPVEIGEHSAKGLIHPVKGQGGALRIPSSRPVRVVYTKLTDTYTFYSGNPARAVREAATRRQAICAS